METSLMPPGEVPQRLAVPAENVNQAKSAVSGRGSRAAAAIESAWDALRTEIPGLPAAIMVIYHAAVHRCGHFAPSCWKYDAQRHAHEVGITPNLFETPEELLGTLIHEAAHAVLFEQDPNLTVHFGGCSSDGYYHRREFRDMCISLGLACGFQNGRYGWCLTWWPEGAVPGRYVVVLAHLKESLPWGTGRQLLLRVRPRNTPQAGHVRLCCQCLDEPRSIYVTRAVLARGGIHCEWCGAEFRPPSR